MSEKRPPLHLESRQPSTSSIRSAGGDRDTSSNDDHPQAQPHPHHPHHNTRAHKKQFIVGGAHSRHHTRVPSFGRNLNKLGKLTPLGTSPAKGAEEKDKSRSGKRLTFVVDGKEGDNNGSGSEGYKDEEFVEEEEVGGGSTNFGGLVTSGGAAAVGGSAKGTLVKSSSTKSLDQQPREGRRKQGKRVGAAIAEEDSKRDRSLSKPRDSSSAGGLTSALRRVSADALVEMNSRRRTEQVEAPSQPQPQNNISNQPVVTKDLHPSLLPHTKSSAAVPPQVNHESISTITKIHHTPPANAPITPAHSLPNSHDQPLTSRFIDYSNSQGNSTSISPSSGTTTYPTTPKKPHNNDNQPDKDTTTTSAAASVKFPPQPLNNTTKPETKSHINTPSRTQQKLWLQRQSSQHESPQHIPHLHHLHLQHIHHPRAVGVVAAGAGAEWYLFQSRAQKEFERVSREYMNTRRFMDPVADSFERTQERGREWRVIPRREGGGRGGNLGLSQSLKETGAAKVSVGMGRAGGKGSARDDSVVKKGGSNARMGGSEREGDGELQSVLVKLWSAVEEPPSDE